MDTSGSCDCGNLFLDYDLLRFGADTGSDSIKVYEIDRESGGMNGTILRDDRRMYELCAIDGIYVVKAVCSSGKNLIWRKFEITPEQREMIYSEGKHALDRLALQLVSEAETQQIV